MKILALGLITLSFNSFAQGLTAQIKNFNINYKAPSGTANSQVFVFRDINYPNATGYSVELQGGKLFLEAPDQSIQLDGLPDFVTQVEDLEVQEVNLSTVADEIEFNLGYFVTRTTLDNMAVKNLSIKCLNQRDSGDLMQDLLDQCLNEAGEVSIEELIQTGKSQFKFFSMNTNNNQMSFGIKAAGYTIKGAGETFFENNMVKIHITKAKYGILNVKSRMFRELQALESSSIRVNNPWIEIDLGTN